MPAVFLKSCLQQQLKSFRDGKRTHASVLFGQTLREAALMAVQAAVGNSVRAAGNIGALQEFVQLLNAATESNSERIGAREWLWLFDEHVAGIFATGLEASMSAASLLSELERRHA